MSRHVANLTGNCPVSGRNFEHCIQCVYNVLLDCGVDIYLPTYSTIHFGGAKDNSLGGFPPNDRGSLLFPKRSMLRGGGGGSCLVTDPVISN